MKSSSTERFKNHPDAIVCHVLWDESREMSHCGPFQPDPFCETKNFAATFSGDVRNGQERADTLLGEQRTAKISAWKRFSKLGF